MSSTMICSIDKSNKKSLAQPGYGESSRECGDHLGGLAAIATGGWQKTQSFASPAFAGFAFFGCASLLSDTQQQIQGLISRCKLTIASGQFSALERWLLTLKGDAHYNARSW
jgi:hypothetical protein